MTVAPTMSAPRTNRLGDSPISFIKVGAKDSTQTAIPANGTSTVVHVK